MQLHFQKKKEGKKTKVIKWITTLFFDIRSMLEAYLWSKPKSHPQKTSSQKSGCQDTEVFKQLRLLNPKTYLAGSHKACMTSNLFLPVLTILLIYFLLTQGMQSFT